MYRFSNFYEFLVVYFFKYNFLKDIYLEDDLKFKKVMEEENIEDDNEDDFCGCDCFKRKELLKFDFELIIIDELVKKNSIFVDVK